MSTYLKIENVGVCPVEGFTLLGASSKRNASDPRTIGMFGSGNKHAAAVLLRSGISPVVFCGRHRLEFSTKLGVMKALDGETEYARVVVRHGGKDESGASVTFTEELSQTDQYGAIDWTDISMSIREYISNALDAGLAVDGNWERVKVEVVEDNQVRAKDGYTRVFLPFEDLKIQAFYANLGRWFLHFSDQALLKQTILPKADRNFGRSHTAVIYRRGVRVREVTASYPDSVFDYNLPNLEMDESRNVDDYGVSREAARALANGTSSQIASVLRAFLSDQSVWEGQFSEYALQPPYSNTKEATLSQGEVWKAAVGSFGPRTILAIKGDPVETLRRKGYSPLIVPVSWLVAARCYGVPVSSTVLSEDERLGRQIVAPTEDAIKAVQFAWDLVECAEMAGDKPRPQVACFLSQMDGGQVVQGFARDGVVYLNRDLASGSGVDLRQTALEEVAHYLTGSKDETRDLQDWAFKLACRIGS